MARLRYKGGGFVPLIPARDLSPEEVKQFGLERLLATGLYQDLHPPRPKREKKEPEPVEELAPPEIIEIEAEEESLEFEEG